ncbi:MAG: ChaN family lipoprotein [Pseudomonadota bacterium]
MPANPVTRRAALGGLVAASGLPLAGCGFSGPRGRGFWSRVEPTVPFPPEASIREVATGLSFWEQDFARALADPEIDLLILGEVHDNALHHQVQAWTLSSLDQLRAPPRARGPRSGVVGLAFEMMTPAQARAATRFLASRPVDETADLAALGQEIGWAESGWPAWELYAQILVAAPTARVTGGAIPREELRAAMGAGAAAWPDAARLGLDKPLDPAEAAVRIQGQIDSHCGLIPPEVAPAMVDAQRIRDASFAKALLDAGLGGFAALIAGAGHARTDWGAPRFIERLAPEKRVVSVGMLEAPAGVDPKRADLAALAAGWGGAAPFDYVVITPGAAREDPCERMRAGRQGG